MFASEMRLTDGVSAEGRWALEMEAQLAVVTRETRRLVSEGEAWERRSAEAQTLQRSIAHTEQLARALAEEAGLLDASDSEPEDATDELDAVYLQRKAWEERTEEAAAQLRERFGPEGGSFAVRAAGAGARALLGAERRALLEAEGRSGAAAALERAREAERAQLRRLEAAGGEARALHELEGLYAARRRAVEARLAAVESALAETRAARAAEAALDARAHAARVKAQRERHVAAEARLLSLGDADRSPLADPAPVEHTAQALENALEDVPDAEAFAKGTARARALSRHVERLEATQRAAAARGAVLAQHRAWLENIDTAARRITDALEADAAEMARLEESCALALRGDGLLARRDAASERICEHAEAVRGFTEAAREDVKRLDAEAQALQRQVDQVPKAKEIADARARLQEALQGEDPTDSPTAANLVAHAQRLVQ